MGHKAAAASRHCARFQAVVPDAAVLLARLFASGFMRFSQLCARVLLSLGFVLLTQGYRVTHVLGVRLPWVKGEDVSSPKP